MAFSGPLYSFLVILLSLELFSPVQGDVTHRTNVRCTSICKEQSARVAQSHQVDCQRGCRYFNIEFLTMATEQEEEAVVDSNSKVELKGVLEQCKTLCLDAYPSDGMRRDACDLGCRCMHERQAKAPPMGETSGFVVYMGAGEQGMVVMNDLLGGPEGGAAGAESGGDSGWVLLNSIFRPSRDYSEDVAAGASTSFKLTETHVQTMPITQERHRFGEYRRTVPHSPFCIPAWLWLIPVMLLMALVYIQYSGNNLKNVLVFEEESSDEEQEILVECTPKEENTFNVTLKDKDAFFVAFEPSSSTSSLLLQEFVEAKLQDLPPKYEERE